MQGDIKAAFKVLVCTALSGPTMQGRKGWHLPGGMWPTSRIKGS